jgi:hypothetical protein
VTALIALIVVGTLRGSLIDLSVFLFEYKSLARILAEREGFEPDSDSKSDQQVTDSQNNLVPSDPPKPP